MAYAVGVDIGGTKIAVGLVDENGLCGRRIQLPSDTSDRQALFQQVVHCIEELIDQTNLDIRETLGIGIGVPGKVDTEKGIAVYQNNLPWDNFPLQEKMNNYFQTVKVVIDNDVNMAAFAEWTIRGQNKKETFVYLTISTGLSCFVIHNGEFIRGAGFAGEIGFFPVRRNPLNGRLESLESVASGPGITRVAREKLGLLAVNESASITTRKIIDDFRRHNPYAIEVMDEVFQALAKGLCAVSCLLDPDKLVFGGGVITHHPDLLFFIKESLKGYLEPIQIGLLSRMEVSQLQEDSGVIGAGLRIHSAIYEKAL